MIVVITSGAHWRDTSVPTKAAYLRQFAHIYDPDSPEDVPHQAHNFITYATALGSFTGPHVLLRPAVGDWGPQDWQEIEVGMRDWREIVETATGLGVVEK